MKNNDDPRKLAHLRSVQEERRAQAILKEKERKRKAAEAMARMAGK